MRPLCPRQALLGRLRFDLTCSSGIQVNISKSLFHFTENEVGFTLKRKDPYLLPSFWVPWVDIIKDLPVVVMRGFFCNKNDNLLNRETNARWQCALPWMAVTGLANWNPIINNIAISLFHVLMFRLISRKSFPPSYRLKLLPKWNPSVNIFDYQTTTITTHQLIRRWTLLIVNISQQSIK